MDEIGLERLAVGETALIKLVSGLKQFAKTVIPSRLLREGICFSKEQKGK
jgi:hypothetical protein